MAYSPRSVKIACGHAGLTHFGGAFFFHEFVGVLQFRNFLVRHLHYPGWNNHALIRGNRWRTEQAILENSPTAAESFQQNARFSAKLSRTRRDSRRI
jgi:hypothetical protein